MTTYKEVFNLAQNKGYKLYLPDIFYDQYTAGTRNEGYSDSTIEAEVKDVEQFLELTLIQKWLRDKKGVNVQLHHLIPVSYTFSFMATSEAGSKIKNYRVEGRLCVDKYEDALLIGIKEALKLI